jgi:hypothetical protein
LRRLTEIALVLAGVLGVVAKLPGRRVYDDANDCFGAALGSFASTEHASYVCVPSYTKLVGTEDAGGWPLVLLAVAVALGAAILHRFPGRTNALAYWVWCGLAGTGVAVMTFDLDLFNHVEILWPERVLGFALGMLAIIVFVTPIVAAVTREQASDSLPVARGSTGNR